MRYASDRILFSEMVTLRSLKQLCTFFTNFSHFFTDFFLFSDYERHPTIAWTFAIVIRHKYGILGVIQSNRGDSTVERFTKCGLAHEIPPDLSVRLITLSKKALSIVKCALSVSLRRSGSKNRSVEMAIVISTHMPRIVPNCPSKLSAWRFLAFGRSLLAPFLAGLPVFLCRLKRI